MTLTVTHSFVSAKPVGNNSSRIYSDSWNANHTLTGTATAEQLNSNVVQAVVNDTNVTGSVASQTLTLRWSGTLGLSRGGVGADLSATGGTGQYLKQSSAGAAVTVGTIPASDVASGAALTRTSDTNVTLTLGGSPTTALLQATSITVGWTGTLAASRGGFGADVSAQSGVPLFATGVATFTGTTGSGNFVRATTPTLVSPILGTPTSGTLTNCNGLPLAGLASQAAFTLVGNSTSGAASPTALTIGGLTQKATPAGTDLVLVQDQAASGAIKYATVSSVASAGVVLRSYLAGLTLSAAGSSATFGIAAGIATDSTNAAMMGLNSAYTKTTSSWAVGSGNGALDTGAISASAWYHVFLIQRTDTGVVDVLVSLSATSPTLPSPYTLFRRIGSLCTSASQWIKFSQLGDEFIWDVSTSNLNAVPGDTTAHSLAVTVPTSVQVTAILAVGAIAGTAADGRVVLSELDKSDEAPAVTNVNAGPVGANLLQGYQRFTIRTNTSAQIRYRMFSTTGQLIVNTSGWIDTRGKLA